MPAKILKKLGFRYKTKPLPTWQADQENKIKDIPTSLWVDESGIELAIAKIEGGPKKAKSFSLDRGKN